MSHDPNRLPPLGTETVVVEPGSQGDPFSQRSGDPQPAVSSADGAPAAQPGSGGEPSPTAQPDPQAPLPNPATQPAPATGEPVAGDDTETVILDEADYEEAAAAVLAELEEEVAPKFEQRIRQTQSAGDRARAELERELQEQRDQLAEVQQQIREGKLAGLSEEDQAKLRSEWALEDRIKAAETYEKDLFALHDDLEIMTLLRDYSAYGVTEELLREVPAEDRVEFCKDAKIEALEELANNGQAASANSQRQPAQPEPSPAPAGVHAPSDTGGDGPIQPAPKANEGQGLDAMAENIGMGWQTTALPGRPRRG